MSLWMKSSSVTIQMKATEQYVLEVLFTMLYKVVLTFESAHEINRVRRTDYYNTLPEIA